MSFSQSIKNELLNQKIKNECCMFAERLGELITTNNGVEQTDINKVLSKKCCISAFLKGLFLGSGCIVDPQSDYHLEIIAEKKDYAFIIAQALKKIKLKPKVLARGKSYMIYIKDSDQIATFLSNIQAVNSYLEYEQIRVEKELKNNINRNINCEAANISKTIEAAVLQIDSIEYLKKIDKYNELSDILKETAILREKYNELSLDELTKKSPSKISKSGLNHRLNRIITIAKKYKGE